MASASATPTLFLFLIVENLYLNQFFTHRTGKIRPPTGTAGHNPNNLTNKKTFKLMGLAICSCPPLSALPDLSEVTCGEDFGQIQKFVFQRRQSGAGTFTTATALLIATWTPLFAETDDTKVQSTPFFENFVIPGGEAITEGGDDNSTLDGIPIVVGQAAPAGSGRFRSLPTANFEELQKYICEVDMTVFMINEAGKIIGYNPTGTQFHGIPFTNFFIGDKSIAGKNTNDFNPFTIAFRPGWSKKLKFLTPTDFDARYDLVNA